LYPVEPPQRPADSREAVPARRVVLEREVGLEAVEFRYLDFDGVGEGTGRLINLAERRPGVLLLGQGRRGNIRYEKKPEDPSDRSCRKHRSPPSSMRPEIGDDSSFLVKRTKNCHRVWGAGK